jgi:glyoxylase-like metal-dependent hydrolase (beta-lactamase superfamily II)
MNISSIQVKQMELGPYGTNTYILIDTASRKSIIIDAPADPDAVIGELGNSKPGYIVITHNHGDHTGALIELKLRLNVPVAAHEKDAEYLPISPDLRLKDEDVVSAGGIVLTVLHTPGHTGGSICLYTEGYLFSGDTIFPGGPGHTLSAAALKQEIAAIASRIMVLPDSTIIYPGHGSSTILGKEKKEFAVFTSKSHKPDLNGDVLWLTS